MKCVCLSTLMRSAATLALNMRLRFSLAGTSCSATTCVQQCATHVVMPGGGGWDDDVSHAPAKDLTDLTEENILGGRVGRRDLQVQAETHRLALYTPRPPVMPVASIVCLSTHGDEPVLTAALPCSTPSVNTHAHGGMLVATA